MEMGARGERARRGAADSGPLLLRGDAVWWQARAGRVTRRQEAECPRGAREHGRAAFPARGAARPPRGGSGGRVGSRSACGWGAPGGPSGPGVSPKSLFRPRMGAGLRKWRGSQISEGQGRGGRDGRAASPGRASLRILDVCRRGSPAPNFSSMQTFRSQRPGPPRRGPGSARGIPVRHPQAGRAGAAVTTAGRPCWDQPSGQPWAQQRRPWRASGARARECVPPPAKFPAQCVVEAEAWSTPDLSPQSF